jgi:hypothetical protein
MTSQPNLVQPPRIAVWLISLFARAEEAESILGDLLEEFSLLAFKPGAPAAQAWYWRQTIKTVPRLAVFAFRTAPWVTVAALVAGFVVRIIVGRSLEYATFVGFHRYRGFFEHHFNVYLLFNIDHLITFFLTGLIVAFVARAREMVSTVTLALIFAVLVVLGSTYGDIRYGVDPILWRLACFLADLLAIVVAGVVVRTHRMAARSRPSAA